MDVVRMWQARGAAVLCGRVVLGGVRGPNAQSSLSAASSASWHIVWRQCSSCHGRATPQRPRFRHAEHPLSADPIGVGAKWVAYFCPCTAQGRAQEEREFGHAAADDGASAGPTTLRLSVLLPLSCTFASLPSCAGRPRLAYLVVASESW